MCWRPTTGGAEFNLFQFPSRGFTGIGMRVRSDLINGLKERFGAKAIRACEWRFAPDPRGECLTVPDSKE